MSSKVVVRNLSKDSTEESVQDYFSFCGDIKSVSITVSDDDRSKEAEIIFESSAAASTAVLLNNALVEGRNISVELIDEGVRNDGKDMDSSSTTRGAYAADDNNGSSTSINSKGSQVLSDLSSQARSVASQVTTATKDFNEKYDITGKLKGAYESAAVSTSATFEKLDAQYDLKGKSAKAMEATKSGISSMYRQISGFWGNDKNGTTTSPSTTTNSNSPRNANNSPSPSTEK